MKHYFPIDEPTPEERFAKLTEEEKKEYYVGQKEYCRITADSKRVFTMKAARRYEYESLRVVLRYLLNSGKLDYFGNEKDFISFQNIMRVLEEKTPPPTEEELKRLEKVYAEWKEKSRQLWEKMEEEEEWN